MPFLPEDFDEGNPLAAEVIAHGIEIDLDGIREMEGKSSKE